MDGLNVVMLISLAIVATVATAVALLSVHSLIRVKRRLVVERQRLRTLETSLAEKTACAELLEQRLVLATMEHHRDTAEIASLLMRVGKSTDLGAAAIEALHRLGVVYGYNEEIGHWEDIRTLIKPGSKCVAQDSQGTCYAGCQSGELCADAVYSTTATWIVDVPRTVMIQSTTESGISTTT